MSTSTAFGARGANGAKKPLKKTARRDLKATIDNGRLHKLAGTEAPRRKTGVRKIGWDEPAADRKIRMRAKTVNFTCTIIARLFIIFCAAWYCWDFYQTQHVIHRGVLFIILGLLADLGRVFSKMMTPGTK